MKYLIIYFIFIILNSINLTYSQSQITEEKELEFLSEKFSTENKNNYFSHNKIFYNIISKTGFCISANSINFRLTQKECGFSENISWSIENKGSEFLFTNQIGIVIDNSQAKVINGNHVIGNYKKNDSNQKWIVESTKHGYSRLRLSNTQFCLDNGDSSKAGTNYVIWVCNVDNTNQWFYIRELLPKPYAFYNIVSKSGLCLSSINKLGKLNQLLCGNSADLIWRFDETEDGYIIQSKNGFVIDNSKYKLINGNDVIGYTRQTIPKQNQIWNIGSVNNGIYINLRLYNTPFCVDYGNSSRDGTNYVLWQCDLNNKNQWFYLKRITSV
jgi:hypothetical protein